MGSGSFFIPQLALLARSLVYWRCVCFQFSCACSVLQCFAAFDYASGGIALHFGALVCVLFRAAERCARARIDARGARRVGFPEKGQQRNAKNKFNLLSAMQMQCSAMQMHVTARAMKRIPNPAAATAPKKKRPNSDRTNRCHECFFSVLNIRGCKGRERLKTGGMTDRM